MPAISQDVTHYAGDTLTITIGPVVDENGAPVDLNGASARWWMGKSVSATGADVYLKKAIGAGLVINRIETDSWELVVSILPADTDQVASGIKAGTYYHEAEVVDADGNVSTVTIGKYVLKPTLIPDIL
jgi:hypothetical protein